MTSSGSASELIWLSWIRSYEFGKNEPDPQIFKNIFLTCVNIATNLPICCFILIISYIEKRLKNCKKEEMLKNLLLV
jgi:hypothetical protein